MLLSGNSFFRTISLNEQTEIYVLRPDRIHILTDAQGFPEADEHKVGVKSYLRQATCASEVGHIKLFHPNNDQWVKTL